MATDQELFASAFKFAPSGMTLVSLEGKFMKVNESLCNLWGYSEEELLKIDFQTITHPEDLQRDLDLLGQLVNGKIPSYRMEKRYFHKDGSLIYALLSVSMIKNAKGEPQFFISQILDMTEIKKAQELMAYNTKMIALGEMAAGIAHEINNPLAIINLNAASIDEAIKHRPTDFLLIESFIKKIYLTVMRISDVVTSLRKLSRRSEEIHYEKCHLEVVIQDALALCQEKCKSSGVKVTKDIIDVEFECRPVELSQVIINLLNNAFYAVQESKEKEIKVKSRIVGDRIKIEVIDTGPGIPENLKKKIMEPYFTTKPLGVGTGLGLSIGRNIIDSHQGKLYLDESAPQTTFVIEYPINRERNPGKG